MFECRPTPSRRINDPRQGKCASFVERALGRDYFCPQIGAAVASPEAINSG